MRGLQQFLFGDRIVVFLGAGPDRGHLVVPVQDLCAYLFQGIHPGVIRGNHQVEVTRANAIAGIGCDRGKDHPGMGRHGVNLGYDGSSDPLQQEVGGRQCEVALQVLRLEVHFLDQALDALDDVLDRLQQTLCAPGGRHRTAGTDEQVILECPSQSPQGSTDRRLGEPKFFAHLGRIGFFQQLPQHIQEIEINSSHIILTPKCSSIS